MVDLYANKITKIFRREPAFTRYFREMSFGERLLGLRSERKMSREALGGQASISARSIENYEKGESVPDLNVLIRLAKALNTTISYLIEETDNPSPDALTKLPFTSEEVEAMGFRARHGGGELADPKQLEKTHLILLRELAEARRKELELKVKESENDLKKRGIDPQQVAGNT